MKKRRSRRRISRRRRSRPRRSRKRRRSRRRSRKRRRGAGFNNSSPLKSVKKPYDCSEEKKEIIRLKQELALRTPKKVFDARFDTPGSTASTNAMWATAANTPLRAKPTPRRGRALSFNNSTQRLSPPITPKSGGRRRRTRKQRGGVCAACLAPLLLL